MRSVECTRRCFDRLDDSEKAAEQPGKGHVKGREPVCVPVFGVRPGGEEDQSPCQQVKLSRFFERLPRKREKREHPLWAYVCGSSKPTRAQTPCHNPGDHTRTVSLAYERACAAYGGKGRSPLQLILFSGRRDVGALNESTTHLCQREGFGKSLAADLAGIRSITCEN